MLNGVKWIFTGQCGAKSSSLFPRMLRWAQPVYSIAPKYWCRTQSLRCDVQRQDIRKQCPQHVNIYFIERENVTVKGKGAKSVSWWYTQAWFGTSSSCVEPHLILIAAKPCCSTACIGATEINRRVMKPDHVISYFAVWKKYLWTF